MPCSSAQRAIAAVSSGVYTDPVGFDGETNTTAFVFSVRAASSWSTVTLYSWSAPANTGTGVPSASWIASGYVVQYGDGSSTSSPGFRITWNAWYTACLPPFVTTTWFGSTSSPESRRVLSTMAFFSAGRPAAGE